MTSRNKIVTLALTVTVPAYLIGKAPCFNSSSTTLVCPLEAATCRAVSPWLFPSLMIPGPLVLSNKRTQVLYRPCLKIEIKRM